MDQPTAIAEARREARRRATHTIPHLPIYVVFDPSCGDRPKDSFYVADDGDFGGFFAGLGDDALVWCSDDEQI